MKPVSAVSSEKVNQPFRDLDNNSSAARQIAHTTLEKLGDAVESNLKSTLAANPSAEAKRSLTALLEKLEGRERLRQGRALEVLEWIDDDQTKEFLKSLASGFPNAWLTLQARASLESDWFRVLSIPASSELWILIAGAREAPGECVFSPLSLDGLDISVLRLLPSRVGFIDRP